MCTNLLLLLLIISISY